MYGQIYRKCKSVGKCKKWFYCYPDDKSRYPLMPGGTKKVTQTRVKLQVKRGGLFKYV